MRGCQSASIIQQLFLSLEEGESCAEFEWVTAYSPRREWPLEGKWSFTPLTGSPPAEVGPLWLQYPHCVQS